jgi:hypothetical protein
VNPRFSITSAFIDATGGGAKQTCEGKLPKKTVLANSASKLNFPWYMRNLNYSRASFRPLHPALDVAQTPNAVEKAGFSSLGHLL